MKKPLRQIKMTVPYSGDYKYYELVLRSYIDYNKETGQAGYAYYRYVNIVGKGE